MEFSAILLSTLFPIAFAVCPGTDSLSDSDVQDVLNKYNIWRGEAARGELYTDQRQLPAGENVYKMVGFIRIVGESRSTVRLQRFP
ncbi:hypothetical protein Y032_0990g3315 [Ancylostoma ceylanicum]|uniref:Uncharacterized protein n=1 Tax=Ancylostoma ceylanicum TaxID=53326 RepID=A0A016W9Q4_9BILA|nr:hypothetical protein Y032_0990g3315 [Ancylostoma ceylanicum]